MLSIMFVATKANKNNKRNCQSFRKSKNNFSWKTLLNWWHQIMNLVKMDIPVSLTMMIMEMIQIMIWVGGYLEKMVDSLEKKKTSRYIVRYVLENIRRPIVQISSIIVPNNFNTWETTLLLLLITNRTDLLDTTDMRIVTTSTEITIVKTPTTAITVEEVTEIITIETISKEATAITETLMTVTETDFKTKVLNSIKTGVKKGPSMLICNQLETIIHKIITSNIRVTIIAKVMDTTSELIWIWSTCKINPLVILNHTTHIIKGNRTIQTVTMSIDTVDEGLGD